MTPTDQRLREIAERVKHINAQWDEGCCPSCTRMLSLNDGCEPIGICDDCTQKIAQDVPFLIALIQKQRAALEHIVKVGEFKCNQMCAEDYIPRGRHSPECPIEYLETAREALNFTPENL